MIYVLDHQHLDTQCARIVHHNATKYGTTGGKCTHAYMYTTDRPVGAGTARAVPLFIKLVECRTLKGEPERSATRTCKEQLHSHDCHQNVTGQ